MERYDMATPEKKSNPRQENGGKKMKKECFLDAISLIFLPASFCLYLIARLALPPFPSLLLSILLLFSDFGFRASDFHPSSSPFPPLPHVVSAAFHHFPFPHCSLFGFRISDFGFPPWGALPHVAFGRF